MKKVIGICFIIYCIPVIGPIFWFIVWCLILLCFGLYLLVRYIFYFTHKDDLRDEAVDTFLFQPKD